MISRELYDWALWIWIVAGIATYLLLFRVIAPFGRHTNTKFGPMLPNRWGWILMESPAVFWFGALFLFGSAPKSTAVWVFFGLWMLHYVHRCFIFPFRIRSKGKKMPVIIAGSAFFFQMVNGFFNGYYLGNFSSGYSGEWLPDPRFILGVSVFATGMLINLLADRKLIALRKPGETDYKIPEGGLYKWISCPNFFGEMLEWAGFALMCWNLAAFSFALWTFSNLLPRARAHHLWYKEKFPCYPAERKAVIPFLY